MFYTTTLYDIIAAMKKLLSVLIILLITNSAFAVDYTHYFEINGQKVLLEEAKSERDKIRGLAKRPYLGENTGMVFFYESQVEQAFWMRNVRFPLDIIFMKDSKITKIYKNAQPCTEEICKIYSSKGLTDEVIEVPAGFCKKHNLKKGTFILVKELNQ